MTDIPAWGQARPIRRGEEVQAQRELESYAYKKWRTTRRNNRLLSVVVGTELAIIFALAFGWASTMPFVRLVPVYYPIQSDGTMDPPKAINSISSDLSEQAVRSVALQFVNACEGYSFANAQYRYDLCSKMSVPHIRDVYQQRWFVKGKPNPESNPQVLYPHGQIGIETISIEVRRGHVAEVRFRRIVDVDTENPVDRKTCRDPICTTWTAVVDLAPAQSMTQELRDMVPSGLMVARYQLVEGKL